VHQQIQTWRLCQTFGLQDRNLYLRNEFSTEYYNNNNNNTYLLTPWCRVLLEKLTGLQLVKKFPAFYGTRRFITALTSVRHLSLSWASPIQSIYPHPTSWRSILILSTHLRLGLPSGLFSLRLPHEDNNNNNNNSVTQEPQYSFRIPLGTHRTSTIQSTVTSHRVVTDVSKDRSAFMFSVKQSEQNDCLAMQQHRWDNLTSLTSFLPYTTHAVCK